MGTTGNIWRRGKEIDIIRAMTQPILNPVDFQSLEPLLPAEVKFARCLAEGSLCTVGNGELPKEEIESGENANIVRGEVIRFFAYGGGGNNPVSGRSIHLRGGWISGGVNLSHANIPVALSFHHCHFDDLMNMQHAECLALYLNGCRLAKELAGYGVKVKGSVFLRGYLPKKEKRPPFSSKGGVSLMGARIDGDLDCREGVFEYRDGNALNAERMVVKGDVRLSRGFSAEGGVHFMGADIGGQLDCAGGRFVNEGDSKYALNAERVKTGGHVYLNHHEPSGGEKSFVALGRVRFANADIGGNFNCKGGRFRHSGKRSALAAGGLKSRAVFLNEGFSAEGEVALHVAHIGNFVCAGCVPNDKSPITINLSSTEAAAVDDDEESWKPFNFLLDGFTYDTFYGRSPTDSTRRLEWLSKRPDKRTLKDGTEVDIPFSPLPYEQAAKVLFEMGHDNDAREILLKKEQEVTKRKNWWHKPYRWLWGEFAGYGYKPGRLLMWALAVVGIGWGVFSDANRLKDIVPHQPAILASHDSQMANDLKPLSVESIANKFPEHPEFNPLVFSADVFIPVFALHQEPFWYPVAQDKNAFAWLLGNPGAYGLAVGAAILCLSLLAALSGLLSLWRRSAWLGEWILRQVCPLVPRAAVVLCLFALGLASPKHWYWLEIGFGWVLTSLFLLSITGLLRPRQSSGEKG